MWPQVLLPIFVQSILGMQFKHPEILWALLLLLIPIFIHLFQLRRFQKTPFTNVKLLKKVVSASRKSSTLKKWLLLLARMGLIAFLVLAFAQPFTAKDIALKPKHYVFYLDNSFSMQAKTGNGPLLQQALQDFAQNIPENETFSFFTNTATYRDVQLADIKNELLQTPYTAKQLSFTEVLLKGQTLFGDQQDAQRHMVLISDFQQQLNMDVPSLEAMVDHEVHLVQLVAEASLNRAIDSVYLENTAMGKGELVVQLSTWGTSENLPVSLYNGNDLMAKTAAQFQNQRAVVRFTLPDTGAINGRVVITDNGLEYDNQFHFNLDATDPIRVLAINGAESAFLSRIFTPAEFVLMQTSLSQLNYSTLPEQNLVVLNELQKLPTALTMALQEFLTNGGAVAVVPPTDMEVASYNAFLAPMANTQWDSLVKQEVPISTVNTAHPLFKNVFEGNVVNFQYPTVKAYFKVRSQLPVALGLQNQTPFLLGNDQLYVFTTALSMDNTNFKNSPLIVPTFYNMGKLSLDLPPLYATLGSPFMVEVPISLSQDDILKVTKSGEGFIPQQEVLPKKVRLLFGELPEKDGIYTIDNRGEPLRAISFNYDRKESNPNYTDLSPYTKAQQHNNLTGFFEEVQKNNTINEFWKWFVILALVFVLLETALHRFLDH